MIVSGPLGASEVAEAVGVGFIAKPYTAGDPVTSVHTASRPTRPSSTTRGTRAVG